MKTLQTIEVDNIKYDINPFPTSVGIRLLTDITKLAGEPLIKTIMLLKSGDDKKKLNIKDVDLSPEMINSIMAGLYDRVDSDTIDLLFKRLLTGTLVANSGTTLSSVYDDHFQGKYLHLFKVVFESFKVQFGDFWKGLGAKGLKV